MLKVLHAPYLIHPHNPTRQGQVPPPRHRGPRVAQPQSQGSNPWPTPDSRQLATVLHSNRPHSFMSPSFTFLLWVMIVISQGSVKASGKNRQEAKARGTRMDVVVVLLIH